MSLFLFSTFTAALEFTEIMYDAPGSDNNQEFVEFFVEQQSDLDFLINSTSGETSIVFSDADSSDVLSLLTVLDSASNSEGSSDPVVFGLIVEEEFNVSSITPGENSLCYVFSAGSTIGNNLGNTADSFSLQVGVNSLSSEYSAGDCSSGNGCSLQRNISQNGSFSFFYEEIPNPCSIASESLLLSNATNSSSQDNESNITVPDIPIDFPDNETVVVPPNSSINDSEIVDDVFENDTLPINDSQENTSSPVPDNTTIPNNSTMDNDENNTVVTNSTNSSSCIFDYSIEVDQIIEAGNTVVYKPILKGASGSAGKPVSLTYWWTDVFGEEVQKKRTTKNLNAKRFTPKKPAAESDWTLVLHTELALNCSDDTLETQNIVVIYGDSEQVECVVTSAQVSSTGSLGVEVAKKQPVVTLSSPEEFSSESFIVSADIFNPDATEKVFSVWSYLYRGSKSFSGERDANKQDIVLAPYESRKLSFPISPTASEPGEYSLKVVALKEGRKTPYEDKTTIELIVENIDMENTAAETIHSDDESEVNTRESSDQDFHKQDFNDTTQSNNMLTGRAVDNSKSLGDVVVKNGAWLGVLFASGLYGVSKWFL